jgi:hypothetical protein
VFELLQPSTESRLFVVFVPRSAGPARSPVLRPSRPALPTGTGTACTATVLETDVAIRKETLILRPLAKSPIDFQRPSPAITLALTFHRPSSASSLRANLAQGRFRTLPEESINGDSIEGASEDHSCIEASVDARQERREDGARSKAKELDEGHRPIRNAEIRRKAGRDAISKEAVAGDAYQTRCDDRAPAGSDCCEAGRSGRRGACRKREGPRRNLTAVRQFDDEKGTARTVPSLAHDTRGRSERCAALGNLLELLTCVSNQSATAANTACRP